MSSRLTVLTLDQGQGVWGAQRYLLRLAPLLAAQGIDLVLGGPAELELASVWSTAGWRRVHIPLPTARSVRRDGDTGAISPVRMVREASGVPRVVRDIAQASRNIGSDAIFSNGHWTHLDAALAARLTGTPAVLHLHEQSVAGVASRMREAAVSLADATVAVSESVAACLSKGPRRKVSVIPNGVDVHELAPGHPDPEVRAQLGARPGETLVVALTRLDPVKRIEDVVEAVRLLGYRSDPGVHLAVVGTTSAYPDYAVRVEELARRELGARATFVGHRSDIGDVLRASDVLIHAGTVEGMPLGLLEAQACGVPVVAYAAAGVAQAVKDGSTGYVVPVGAVDQLSVQLARLVADPALRSDMGAAGRKHVVRTHSLTGQASSLAALTREVVAVRQGVAA